MDDPILNQLVIFRSPELASALRSRIESITQQWEATVRRNVAKAAKLPVDQLRDNTANALHQLADAMESTNAQPAEDFLSSSAEHGQVRYEQELDLNDLLNEYSLLRTIIFHQITDQLKRQLTADEITTLDLGVDLAMRRGVLSYVQERTAQLRTAAEAQSKYLSFLSHDMRGGLNGILLMVEVLRRELSPHPQFASSLEDLDMMRRSILDTVATMDRFLHAERFRKGKVQVKWSRFNVQILLDNMSTQFSPQAREKGLELRISNTDRCEVVSDPDLIALVMQNLIGNALKYTPRGLIQVQAKRGTKATPDRGCTLSVIDQGPGINADKLSQLFAPFTRGETHGQPGTGMGLTIARQAATLLGANLFADSEPGKGSAFHLELPHKDL